jgi:hypothetical protein
MIKFRNLGDNAPATTASLNMVIPSNNYFHEVLMSDSYTCLTLQVGGLIVVEVH